MDNRFVFKHPNIPTETLTVYDARKEPLHIYGLYQPQNEGLFRRMPAEVAEKVRESAVRIYSAIGCQGLSRVDFFVTFEDERVVFNEINTLPGFTSISMYPKLFAASGIPGEQLIDQLIDLAVEANR